MTVSVAQAKGFAGATSGTLDGNVTAGNTVFLVLLALNASSGVVSSSAPTIGGVTPAGSVQLSEQQERTGSFTVYETVWMMPACPGGSASVGITLTNGIVNPNTGLIAYEAAGLGSAPSLDQRAQNTGNSSTASSGTTGGIASGQELVLGASCVGSAFSSNPSGFAVITLGGGAGSAGYQVVSNPGGTYSWAGPLTSAAHWAAGVVTVAVTPVPPPPPPVLMPPGLASPAAWQYLPGPRMLTSPSTTAPPPPVPYVLPAAPLMPPGLASPAAWQRQPFRRTPLPPVSTAVSVRTTGSSFSPVIELAGGSAATVTWSCPGFASQAGLAPSFSFGSAAVRFVTMTVTGGGGYADVTAFNLGYDNTVDNGLYMPPARFVKPAESLSAVSNISLLTGLVYFLADHTAVTGPLDFTGMAALQFIQCYDTNLTGVTLTGCTALIRLQVEASNVSYLDLNPVAGNLYDLRAAAQKGGSLTFATLTSPVVHEYHFCVRDQAVINPPTFAQLPAIVEYWVWNTGLGGQLAPRSPSLNWIIGHDNGYTSADLTGQFPPGNGSCTLTLNKNLLNDVNLTGCSGLTSINLANNNLNQAAVDSVLRQVASWGTPNGTLDLRANIAPSGTGAGYAAALTARGWTVSTDTLRSTAIAVAQSIDVNGAASGDFAVAPGWGDTVILAVCAYTSVSATITSSAPTFGNDGFVNTSPAGAVKLLEAMSPVNGGNAVYFAVWLLPNVGDGTSTHATVTVRGQDGIPGFFAWDVTGLGQAPVLDRSSGGSSGSGSAVDSGTAAALRFAPGLVIGVAQVYAGSAAGPGAPWTVLSPIAASWAGYQVATAAGGAYGWQQTAADGAHPWAAGVVAVTAAAGGELPGAWLLPSRPLMPPGLGSPAAWQFPRYVRLPPLHVIDGTGGVTLPKPSLAAASPPPVTAAPAQGGWWQLHSIITAAAQEREFWDSQPAMACPRCGEPLRPAPSSDSGSAVESYCQFDGFRYPGDWDASTMSGM